MATNDFPIQNHDDGREALRLLILSGMLALADSKSPVSGLGEGGWMRLMKDVTPLQGAAIVLRVMHGWSNRRIGEYMNSTHATVSMCINLGLAKLAASSESMAFLQAAAGK